MGVSPMILSCGGPRGAVRDLRARRRAPERGDEPWTGLNTKRAVRE
jgi:hypothetical protein